MPPDRHTLEETERAAASATSHLRIDVPAMYAMSSVFRAANALRDRVTRDVLWPHDLTWTGFLVLWILWIWQERESFEVAESVGISKATLTGVVRTLQAKELVVRTVPPTDRRRVLLRLSPTGQALMEDLFPQFNAEEVYAVSGLTSTEISDLTDLLRKVIRVLD